MEAEVVKQFSQELASLYETKPPISKAKMVQVTKTAIKGIKYYKHIVMAVEKFIHRCKPEYKLPGLYVIDSIVRQSRHQFGADKDVFAPRFGKNIITTFQSLHQCVEDDKPKILRVLNLWIQNNVFTDDILQPVVEMAAKLAQDVGEDEKQAPVDKPLRTKKIDSPKVLQEIKNSPHVAVAEKKSMHTGNAPGADAEHANLDPSFMQQIQKLTSTLITQQKNTNDSERRLTKKLLADYDYSDDDSGDEESSEKGVAANRDGPQRGEDMTANLAAAAQNLLNNPQLLQQIQQMQQSMRNPASGGPVLPPSQQQALTRVPPPQTGIRFQPHLMNFNVPPPNYVPPTSTRIELHPPQPVTVARTIDLQSINCPPPAEPLPPGFVNQSRNADRDERRRDEFSRRHEQRSRSRSKSKEKKRRRKSRSRSGSRSRRRNRSRSRSADRRNREKERERRNRGLPPMKARNVSICSRTLWFGRVPMYCEQEEIKEAVKDYGEPVSVDLIPPRGCAYVVMPDRKSAFKVLERLKDLRIQNRAIKMAWAPGKGVKKAFEEGWDPESGVTYVPHEKIPLDLTSFLDGGMLDVETLPDNLKTTYNENGRVGAVAPTNIQPAMSAQISAVAGTVAGASGIIPPPIPYPMFYPGMSNIYSTPVPTGQFVMPPIIPQLGGTHSPMMNRLPPPTQQQAQSVPSISVAPPTGNPLSLVPPPIASQSGFGSAGVGVRPSLLGPGNHVLPPLMSLPSSGSASMERFPYSPQSRGNRGGNFFRGGGGRGGRGSRFGGTNNNWSGSNQQHYGDEPRFERNFRGGGGGFGREGGGMHRDEGRRWSDHSFGEEDMATNDPEHSDMAHAPASDVDRRSFERSGRRRSRWADASPPPPDAQPSHFGSGDGNSSFDRQKPSLFENTRTDDLRMDENEHRHEKGDSEVARESRFTPPPPGTIEHEETTSDKS